MTVLDVPKPTVPAPEPSTRGRRARIWEVKTNCHCLICGTCFSITELRKIGAKAGIGIPKDATDYQIHSQFVKRSARQGPVAKLMQKALDRKYRAVLERCRPLNTEAELRAFWQGSLEKGDIAGPFWALMTHPALTDSLAIDLFGELHMLSHLEGSVNRANQRRLHAVTREKDTMAPQMAETRQRMADKDAEIQALREQLRQSATIQTKLDAATEKLRRFESGAEHQTHVERIAKLESAVAAAEKEAGTAQIKLATESARRRSLDRKLRGLIEANEEIEAECESLSALVESWGQAGDLRCQQSRQIPCDFDLAGRSIVYVGGRLGLIAHFRALVEKANGRFIHHDGGMEENQRRLGHMLAQGDVILCPIDCVSHRACGRAKQFCKRSARIFLPLRSSGLSSFVNALRQISEQTDEQAGYIPEAAE